jgi:hypothetical protein
MARLAPVKLSWAIQGHGAGSDDVDDVEQAARRLRVALVDCWPDIDADSLVRLLAPVRMALVTDGAYAVMRGREWSIQAPGLLVTLTP